MVLPFQQPYSHIYLTSAGSAIVFKWVKIRVSSRVLLRVQTFRKVLFRSFSHLLSEKLCMQSEATVTSRLFVSLLCYPI
jgi:hypothetical protein